MDRMKLLANGWGEEQTCLLPDGEGEQTYLQAWHKILINPNISKIWHKMAKKKLS